MPRASGSLSSKTSLGFVLGAIWSNAGVGELSSSQRERPGHREPSSFHWWSLVRLWHLVGPPGTTSPFPLLTPQEADSSISGMATLTALKQLPTAMRPSNRFPSSASSATASAGDGATMIAHLQGREQALEPFGWTGRRAKWIALACLHSGVFTRAQWTRFLGCHTEKVRRAAHALIAQGVAAEENVLGITGISRVCRIYGRGIYTGRTRANRRVEGTDSQASWPGADSPRHHLADRAPLRSALPMTGLRVMPLLGRENDAGGRFTAWPGPDSHGAHRISADATASYASAARPDVARRADEADMGATPQAEGLVRARGRACFHTLAPALQGSLPNHGSLREGPAPRAPARWRLGGRRPRPRRPSTPPCGVGFGRWRAPFSTSRPTR